jgi:hypothetical protein
VGPRPVWMGAETLVPTVIRFPDLPARSELLYCKDMPFDSVETVVTVCFEN